MKGFFKPKNPKKYKGDVTAICYRSSYELKLMIELDRLPDIIEWQSEEYSIQYRSPIDNKIHRYYPDFHVKKRLPNGQIENIVIEVKPANQVKEPVKSKKITKGYIREVMTYGVNQAKWEAAKKYCASRGWKFLIFSEKELGIK